MSFKNLVADVCAPHLYSHGALLNAPFSHLLQLIKRLYAVSGLRAACTGRRAHPFEFGAVEIVSSGYLRIHVVYALLPLFEIVAVVALVGVEP